MANEYMPIGISMKNRRALVVGGGQVALRKVDRLLDYDSQITVIAPEVDDKLVYYGEHNKIKLERRGYQEGEASDFGLVIAASDDAKLNHQVYDEAHAAGIPVNVVDDPDYCDFIMPATTKRGCLTVSVSTDGQAPFLAAFLRQLNDDIFPERWRKVSNWAAKFRRLVHQEGPSETPMRMRCYERFLEADWKDLLKNKNDDEIEQTLRSWLEG
ncbi:MAG: bifunctional precorrin-2 dehydrogenase/sirohydrochlorin ferrochelatase [bacterium]